MLIQQYVLYVSDMQHISHVKIGIGLVVLHGTSAETPPLKAGGSISKMVHFSHGCRVLAGCQPGEQLKVRAENSVPPPMGFSMCLKLHKEQKRQREKFYPILLSSFNHIASFLSYSISRSDQTHHVQEEETQIPPLDGGVTRFWK